MKINHRLMSEIEELWCDHEEAFVYFGQACVEAAKAGHKCKVRRYLRRGAVVAALVTIFITSCLDSISETH